MATTCRAGSSRPPWARPAPSLHFQRHPQADIPISVTDVDPDRIIIYNARRSPLSAPISATDVLERYGVDPSRPIVLFVGRVTRQKGIIYLARAIPLIDPSAQVVLCAGAPDTPEIAAEMEQAVAEAQRQPGDVIWIEEMMPREELIQFYSHATVFYSRSICRQVRHHQSGGDGVWDAGCRQRRWRHTRSRGRR